MSKHMDELLKGREAEKVRREEACRELRRKHPYFAGWSDANLLDFVLCEREGQGGHKWVVFGRLHGDIRPTILVECAGCHIIGHVRSFTKKEWYEATGTTGPHRFLGEGEVVDWKWDEKCHVRGVSDEP